MVRGSFFFSWLLRFWGSAAVGRPNSGRVRNGSASILIRSTCRRPVPDMVCGDDVYLFPSFQGEKSPATLWKVSMSAKVFVSGVLAVAVLAPMASVVQADVFNMPEGQTSLETVVGNPGNAGERPYGHGTTGYGAVAYGYQMGKYEVTNAQYCQFLNAKLPHDQRPGNTATILPSDTYGLYDRSMETKSDGGINMTRQGRQGRNSR